MRKAIPNLFIVGAPKCGTTAWVRYLSEHPDVFFSSKKEPHYFCDDFPGFRWIKSEPEYDDLFVQAHGARIIGEASVQYLYSKVAARNVGRYNPDARILVFLRQQSTFLPSYHHQLLYNLDEDIPDFATAWSLAISGGRSRVPAACREPAFLDYPAVGRFDEQLQRYLDVFPPEQIKVIRFEEWIKNPRRTYLDILSFLGLTDDGRTRFEPVHAAKHHRFAFVSRLTQRPPSFVLHAARWIRNVTGRRRLGVAGAIRWINSVTGYRSPVSDELRAEIDAYFATSNHRLDLLMQQIDPRPGA